MPKKSTKKTGDPAVVLQHRLDALLRAGQMCSNCCFNIAQRENMQYIKSKALIESYKAWDAASLAIRKVMPPNEKVSV